MGYVPHSAAVHCAAETMRRGRSKRNFRNMTQSHGVGRDAKIALITGVTGQDGALLAEFLLQKGYTVHGIKRRSSSFNTGRVDHLYIDPHQEGARFFMHHGDLTDATNLIRIVQETQPTEIYNLAAQSHVQVSFETPEYTANADALGALRLLEAIRILRMERSARFYQASTSELYGNAKPPQNELTAFQPRSPYAAAKLYGFWITVNYREAYGIHASNGILFNHEGPTRGETFVTRKITRAVARINAGSQTRLYLGNLDARRDWGHARDYVEAMWLMLQQETPDDYVIASGVSRSVKDLVQTAFGMVGLDWTQYVQVDPAYVRPAEVSNLCGDARRARERLGWVPKITFDGMIREMLECDMQAGGVEPARYLTPLATKFSSTSGP